MSNPMIFTDQTPTTTGTSLSAANLNTAVPASPYVISGGFPGSVSGASLSITQPSTQAVVPASTTSEVYVNVSSQTLTVPNTPTGTYFVDLTSSSTYTVTQGSVAANALRLYSVSSSGTGLSTLIPLAQPLPLAAAQIQGDQSQAASNDPLLTSGFTIVNNLNIIRYWMGQIGLGAWNALSAAIPLSQKGAASGVAPLTAQKLLDLSTAGTPTVLVQPAAGTGATASLVAGSTDARGVVNLNTGTGTVAGAYFTFTFSTTLTRTPVVLLGFTGPNTASAPISGSVSTTGFSMVNATMVASSSYQIAYLIIE